MSDLILHGKTRSIYLDTADVCRVELSLKADAVLLIDEHDNTLVSVRPRGDTFTPLALMDHLVSAITAGGTATHDVIIQHIGLALAEHAPDNDRVSLTDVEEYALVVYGEYQGQLCAIKTGAMTGMRVAPDGDQYRVYRNDVHILTVISDDVVRNDSEVVIIGALITYVNPFVCKLRRLQGVQS